NILYKQKKFDVSSPEFRKALTINPSNPVAYYNLGNSLFRQQNWPEAEMTYSKAIEASSNSSQKEKATYNKGVSLSKQKKLEESIFEYKNALKLNPSDEDARVNLQKALLERKKDASKNQGSSKQQKPRQQPRQNQSKLTKKQVEQLLRALRQKEQDVQQKMQQNKTRSTTNPEKDW
ncbi:MAG TPA: tetratricopeptide repeat protein, partial [Flavitalea sp.]|nr:tetratricopeptide repeat protein [Flavitalea sp.]